MRRTWIVVMLGIVGCITPPGELPGGDDVSGAVDAGTDASMDPIDASMPPGTDSGVDMASDLGGRTDDIGNDAESVDVGPDLPPPNVVEEVEPNDSSDQAAQLVPGDHFAGVTEDGTNDWFQIDVTDAPCLVTIGSVEPASGDSDNSVDLRILTSEPWVTQRVYRTFEGPERSFFVSEATRLRVRVGQDASNRSYEFWTERREVPELMTLASPSVLRRLEGYAPDFWSLEVVQPTSYVATMERDLARSATIDPFLMLYDPNAGVILAADDDISSSNTNSQLRFDLEPGTYWLVATGWNIPLEAYYSLTVSAVP